MVDLVENEDKELEGCGKPKKHLRSADGLHGRLRGAGLVSRAEAVQLHLASST
jgi:hypothetical protein